MNIHYDTATGQIVSYGFGADHGDGFETSPYPNCSVAIIDDQPIDARAQKFDPVTWKVVDKDVPDPEPDQVWRIRELVRAELGATDKFALPDYPVADADRVAWVAYRKALRDASKGNATAAAMLAAIPLRPDGSDPAAQLRALLAGGNDNGVTP
ncbi:phage tail assembly chaperone [Bradyrhizobium cosmicum]|uniref:phage tail assembly chaperone n=1 Tax=Bradyrhizobium cosmicum TaxID=1404864 RepID=UPI0011633307|nr:phage tail assembly chaperone [Bradyrhizobium cosmicum]QDP20656.1 hypothetical protein FNV92_00155 [Bradyrhizobium cosmicum]QDP27006.1 hypothetical protein FNV92_34850 [Bradyrhizobium cosmicum]